MKRVHTHTHWISAFTFVHFIKSIAAITHSRITVNNWVDW